MKIPDKIKFLGHEYEIKEVSANDIEGCNGQTWLKKCLIMIDKDLPQSRKESVLLHEIIEIIDGHFKLEINHKSIEILEEVLYVILKENQLDFNKGE